MNIAISSGARVIANQSDIRFWTCSRASMGLVRENMRTSLQCCLHNIDNRIASLLGGVVACGAVVDVVLINHSLMKT